MPPHQNNQPEHNRRQFIKGAIAFPLLANTIQAGTNSSSSAMKIRRIEIYPARYPMTGHFKFFTGPHGSKGRAAVFVKIVADNGAIGWGQSVPIAKWSYETLETVTIALRRYFAPQLINKDASNIEGAHQLMSQAIANGFSTGMPIARSGIDVALHDLNGQLAKKSLAQLWDRPTGGPIKLSWTLNPQTLEDVDSLIDEGFRKGYKHFNIKVAPNPEFDFALAAAVRRRAPDCFLWADANGGYTPESAILAAPRLADIGVNILEAPVQPNQISTYQTLKKQGALPILMDEGVVSPVDLREFIRLNMIDGVAMKHSRCGGLVSAKKQIEMIEAAGLMWVGSGLTDPDISLAATLGLYGAFGLDKPAALNGPQFLTADVLHEPIKVLDGTLSVPTGHGIGVKVDESKVRALSKSEPFVIE